MSFIGGTLPVGPGCRSRPALANKRHSPSEGKPSVAARPKPSRPSSTLLEVPAKTLKAASHFTLKTLYTELGLFIPLKVRSPIGSTSTMSLAALYTLWLIKI